MLTSEGFSTCWDTGIGAISFANPSRLCVGMPSQYNVYWIWTTVSLGRILLCSYNADWFRYWPNPPAQDRISYTSRWYQCNAELKQWLCVVFKCLLRDFDVLYLETTSVGVISMKPVFQTTVYSSNEWQAHKTATTLTPRAVWHFYTLHFIDFRNVTASFYLLCIYVLISLN
jgi:hypothetical protein